MPLPTSNESPLNERELVLVRETQVSAEKLFAGWTQPGLMVQWFCPKPWSLSAAEIDLRPGGLCKTVMRSPEGEEFPNTGVYLEVVPNERLVFTDAYGANWEPSASPFFTAIVTFETRPGGGTRYTARAMHWRKEDCEQHAAMGFLDGWGKAFDQLVELCESN